MSALKSLLRVKPLAFLAVLCLAIDIVAYTHFDKFIHFFNLYSGLIDSDLDMARFLALFLPVSVAGMTFGILSGDGGDERFKAMLAKLSWHQCTCLAITLIAAGTAVMATAVLLGFTLIAVIAESCIYAFSLAAAIGWTTLLGAAALIAIPLGYRCVAKAFGNFPPATPPVDAA